LLDARGSLRLVTDEVHEGDARCLALTCRALRDALCGRSRRSRRRLGRRCLGSRSGERGLGCRRCRAQRGVRGSRSGFGAHYNERIDQADVMKARFPARPAGDAHAGARVRTRDASVVGTVGRLAWVWGLERQWPWP
jgi:hypothetical protein